MHICVLDHPRIPSETRFNDIANTPLWSCLMGGYAAAALSARGFDVAYLDAAADAMDFESLGKRLAEMAPDLLAVNAVYFWEHTACLFAFISELKHQHPALHITLFGFFPSLAPARILDHCPAVDSICLGECEHTLGDMAAAIQQHREWREVPGLAFAQGRQAIFSPTRPPDPDPDRFAWPLRPFGGDVGADETAAILASRGCYNHCTFCPIPAFERRGAGWRGRSPANIVSEVADLAQKGYGQFYFVDPNFIGPGRRGRMRTLDLMRQLGPLNIRFGMETRPNDLDEELMAAMTQAGLTSLLLGIESASPGVLGTLSKHSSAKDSRRAIALCRDAGIEPEVGFIMHTPDTTLEDMVCDLAFLDDCRLLDRLDRTANLLCHRQIVFRGTCGFENYSRQGRIVGMDPLGFEARIAWQDPRAAWATDVMVPVCLDVLREMGDPGSALYWKDATANPQALGRVNDCLVSQFRLTLSTAGNAAPLTEAADLRRRIRLAVFESL